MIGQIRLFDAYSTVELPSQLPKATLETLKRTRVRHVPINQGFFAYSCLAQIDAYTLGVLYEDRPSSHIQFQTFELAELMG